MKMSAKHTMSMSLTQQHNTRQLTTMISDLMESQKCPFSPHLMGCKGHHSSPRPLSSPLPIISVREREKKSLINSPLVFCRDWHSWLPIHNSRGSNQDPFPGFDRGRRSCVPMITISLIAIWPRYLIYPSLALTSLWLWWSWMLPRILRMTERR